MKKTIKKITASITALSMIASVMQKNVISAFTEYSMADTKYTGNGILQDAVEKTSGVKEKIYFNMLSDWNKGAYCINDRDEEIFYKEVYESSIVKVKEGTDFSGYLFPQNALVTDDEDGYRIVYCNGSDARNDLYADLMKLESVISIEENNSVYMYEGNVKGAFFKKTVSEKEILEKFSAFSPESMQETAEQMNFGELWNYYTFKCEDTEKLNELFNVLTEMGESVYVYTEADEKTENKIKEESTVIFNKDNKERFQKLTFEELLEMKIEEIEDMSLYAGFAVKNSLGYMRPHISIKLPDECWFEKKVVMDVTGEDGEIIQEEETVYQPDIKKTAEFFGIPEKLIKSITEKYVPGRNGFCEIEFIDEVEDTNNNDTKRKIMIVVSDRLGCYYNPFTYTEETYYYDEILIAPLEDKINYGDLDANKVVDLSDLTILSQYLLKDIELEADQIKCADVNSDEDVNLQDLTLMKQYVMNDDVKLGVKGNISSEDTKKDNDSNEISEIIWLGYSFDAGTDHDALNGEISSAVLRSVSDLSEYLSAAEKYPVIGSYLEKYDEEFFEENILVLKLIEQTVGAGAGFSIENIKYSDEKTLQIECAKVDEQITGPAAAMSWNIAAVSIPADDFHADTVEWILIN